jgi:hypothetical protein
MIGEAPFQTVKMQQGVENIVEKQNIVRDRIKLYQKKMPPMDGLHS